MTRPLALLAPLAPFVWGTLTLPAAGQATLNEIRVDQPGGDPDEYAELAGSPGAALDGLTYVVLGDSGANGGVVEQALDLTGQALDGDGLFVVAEASFTLGTPDLVASLAFENDDNVTHLLVTGFAGSVGDDLDTDDDGTLETVPWTAVVDCVALVEESPGGDPVYCATTVGPGAFGAPGHVFRCDGGWQTGAFDPVGGDDTAGAANPCPPAGCIDAELAARCAILRSTLEGAELGGDEGLVVVHYNAGTSSRSADADDIAFVEVLDAQLASSPVFLAARDHALNATLPAPSSDSSNLPPALATVDSLNVDFGEPAFGGLAADWTLDRYDGANLPGDLVGARQHTLLFGAAGDGLCNPAALGAEPLDVLELVLRIEGGILHAFDEPEVDLVTAAAWDGAAYATPVPGAFPLQPFVRADLTLVELGLSSDPAFLTGSADPGFVRVLRIDECAPGALDLVAERNLLTLEPVDPQPCYAEDALVCFELRMACLDQPVTGFFATVTFDPALVDLDPSSAYTSSPFPLHILPIADAGGGRLLLDGSVDFGEAGVTADALLATLCFRVRAGNDGATTAVGFSDVEPFPNELSFEGLPVVTRLGVPPAFGIDQTPPSITCPAPISVSQDPPSACSAVVELTLPAASDDCGLRSIEGVRSDALPLDAPFPAGCSPGALTQVTWTATDCAGLTATCVQDVRVIDSFTGGPLMVGFPSDVTVPADAGGCTAVVTYARPTAVDNCDPSPTVVCAPPSGFAFPAGTTEVACTATDSCGNATIETFDVTVVPENDVAVTVELVGVYSAVTRCVRFVAGDCTNAVDVELLFVDHDGDDLDGDGLDDGSGTLATPVRASDTIRVPCGHFTEICAKDEQHTLWATTSLSIAGPLYTADGVLSLAGGDADNDGDVDLGDISVFLAQFGGGALPGGCPWNGTQDADFSNNGVVGSEDYAHLTASYLQTTSCGCTTPLASSGDEAGDTGHQATGAPRPRPATQRSARPLAAAVPLAALPPAARAAGRGVDRDGDGVFDHRDVAAFEREHGLPATLSEALRVRAR